MVWPTYNAPHFCFYRRVSGSSNQTDKAMKWIDKCRCGRIIEATVAADESGIPKVRKCWFDRDGNLDRVTGTNENVVVAPKTPPNNLAHEV